MVEVGDWVLLDVESDDGQIDWHRAVVDNVKGKKIKISFPDIFGTRTVLVDKSEIVRPSKKETDERLLVVAAPVWKLKTILKEE